MVLQALVCFLSFSARSTFVLGLVFGLYFRRILVRLMVFLLAFVVLRDQHLESLAPGLPADAVVAVEDAANEVVDVSSALLALLF